MRQSNYKYKGWKFSHNVMLYLDEYGCVVKGLYFDDKTGQTLELIPFSLGPIEPGYHPDSDVEGNGVYTMQSYFRKENLSKHKLANIETNSYYDPETYTMKKGFLY